VIIICAHFIGVSKPPISGIFNLLMAFSFLQIKKINTYHRLFLNHEKFMELSKLKYEGT